MRTLRDSDIFGEPKYAEPKTYEKRTTVKAIVTNDSDQLAFVLVSAHDYLLLAGGGAESSNLAREVERECLEELSWKVRVEQELGMIREFRNRQSMEYETHYFFARALEPTGTDGRTDSEKDNDLSVVWVNRKDVLEIIERQEKMVRNGGVDFYNTAFNIVRDGIFLREWLG